MLIGCGEDCLTSIFNFLEFKSGMSDITFTIQKPFCAAINFAWLKADGEMLVVGWLRRLNCTPIAIKMGICQQELMLAGKSVVQSSGSCMDRDGLLPFIHFHFVFGGIDPTLREFNVSIALETEEKGWLSTTAGLILPPSGWYEPSLEVYHSGQFDIPVQPNGSNKEIDKEPIDVESRSTEELDFRIVQEIERSIIVNLPEDEDLQLALLARLSGVKLTNQQLIFLVGTSERATVLRGLIKGAEVIDVPLAGQFLYQDIRKRVKGRYLIFIQNLDVEIFVASDMGINLLQEQDSFSYIRMSCSRTELPDVPAQYQIVSVEDRIEHFAFNEFPHQVIKEICEQVDGDNRHSSYDLLVAERVFFNDTNLGTSVRQGISIKELLAGGRVSSHAVHERVRSLLKQTRLRGSGKSSRVEKRQRREVSAYVPDLNDNNPSYFKKCKVAIVTLEFEGPFRNGGIGTAYTGLAHTLASAGHDVTVLYCGQNISDSPIEEWVTSYATEGISLEVLPPVRHPFPNNEGRWKSYHVYQCLRERQFDIVHVHDLAGLGYYSMLAKKQGLSFINTSFILGLHSPIAWVREASNAFCSWEGELENDFMEQESIKMADVLVSPSKYMCDWIQDRAWELPEEMYVLPNICPDIALEDVAGQSSSTLKEIVFFGRLETRKGIELFCNALDLLNQQPCPPFRVVFMGKAADMGHDCPTDLYIKRRAARWAFPVEIIVSLNNKQALEYLKSGNRIVVIPSLSENSPFTVLECLKHQIPFLASNVGGIPELIEESGRARYLFEPNQRSLSERLLRGLINGVEPVEPAVQFVDVKMRWLALHQYCLNQGSSTVSCELVSTATKPLVSVCMAHKDRPQFLEQALMSLEGQTYDNFEVIVVDDESEQVESIEYLESLKKATFSFDLQVIRQKWSYLGAARNLAALHARGEYLLFMDDDNVAKPVEIGRFVEVASKQPEIDIFTPMNDRFRGDDYPQDSLVPIGVYLPLGGSAAFGFLQNVFGDANFLIKRKSFLKIGGFWESVDVGYEDWQFLAHATIAGLKQQVIPEALYWYRVGGGGMLLTTQVYNSLMTVFQPYWQRIKGGFQQLLPYLFMLNLRNHGRAGELSGRKHSEDALFELGQSLLLLNSENSFAGIRAHYQLFISILDSGLLCEATGTDPILLLPEFPSPEAGSLIVSVCLESPADTTCELFFLKDRSEDYSWKRCVALNIGKGLNSLMFKIDDLPIAGQLRLDPGFEEGVYKINSIEVRHTF